MATYTYTENGVTFSSVVEPAQLIGGYPMATYSNKYVTESGNTNIQNDWEESFNAIDIDWNGVSISGVSGTIGSTSDVLKLIGDLYARLSVLENQSTVN